MDAFAVDVEACRGRQRRLLDAIEPLNVDLTILSRRESVQWLTGAHVRPPFEPLAAMTSAGKVTLVMPDRQVDDLNAADEVLAYEGKWLSTMRDEQRAASSAVLQAKLGGRRKRVACEFEAFCPQLLLGWNVPLVEIDAIVFELRQRKDADEVRMLRRANDANCAMYARAREIVRPDVNELDVYAELHAVAVHTLGEPLTYFGQDFRSAARGGPSRDRQIEAGELYILDLGVGFRGYFSDNARTIAVGGEPSPLQQRAWEAATAALTIIETKARPGASCRELFRSAHEQLNGHAPWVFNHHFGHGVGLAAHEGPHLNPNWDDTLAEGHFLAVEPGLYHDELRVGVRVEQNYLVTANGVVLLTNWPLDL
jgi:Xaa-Pro aminopeptidase